MPGSVLASGRYRVVADISGKKRMNESSQSQGSSSKKGALKRLRLMPSARGARGSALDYRPPTARDDTDLSLVSSERRFKPSPWLASYRAPMMFFSFFAMKDRERARERQELTSKFPLKYSTLQHSRRHFDRPGGRGLDQRRTPRAQGRDFEKISGEWKGGFFYLSRERRQQQRASSRRLREQTADRRPL